MVFCAYCSFKLEIMNKLFCIFFVIVLYSCNGHDFFAGDKNIDYQVRMDTFSKRGYSSVKFTRFINSQLKINSLEKGYDSVQIRLIFEYADVIDVIILKCNKGWKGMSYNLKLGYDDQKGDYINHLITQRVQPPDWHLFMNRLNENDIGNLPDCTVLPGYETYDGSAGAVTVEYADKFIYRQYTYHSPESFKSNLAEQKKIRNIIQTVSKELNILRIGEEFLKYPE